MQVACGENTPMKHIKPSEDSLNFLIGRHIKWESAQFHNDSSISYTRESGIIESIDFQRALIKIDNPVQYTHAYLGTYEVVYGLDDYPARILVSKYRKAIEEEKRLADRSSYDIYALIDPRDDAVRYVGISANVKRRYKQHAFHHSKNTKKDAWTQELRDQGLQPLLSIIETVCGSVYASQREQYWIRHYLQQGAALTNLIISVGVYVEEAIRTNVEESEL